MTAEHWNAAQYNKFREQRMQPFFDLVAMIQVKPGMRVIDLGCGTGELTALLAERLPQSTVEGIDASAAMLEQAEGRAGGRLSFRQEEISQITGYGDYDLVFSHAALQWVPDNETLMARILDSLKPGAQVAIQVPRNEAHPSHAIAEQLALEEPFRTLLHGYVRESQVLTLERYSTLFYRLQLREQTCIEKIYGHELPDSAAVIEWVKGTSLNAYLSRLDESGQAAFLAAYRERLIQAIGEHSPYFYPFRRMLFWGQKAA